ncbi:acyl-CoA dehydrogenase family protein [Streptomyces sp. NBC_00080]|uniref:acyl-CoA dehydrogenase family protein n=1 Tax=Streptomyces sp. NBC_00080 TaxID=2975645 RepID=UPI0032502D0C
MTTARLRAREFACDVLAAAHAETTKGRNSPQEVFAATEPYYAELVREGYLRAFIPAAHGGDGDSVREQLAIVEEFAAVEPGVTLTLLATTLGLAPLLTAGTAEQKAAHLPPFLTRTGTPLASFAFSEPGGSADFDAPAPAEGTRTTATRDGADWVITGAKQWISNAMGWGGDGPTLLTVTAMAGPGDPDTSLAVFALPGRLRGLTCTPMARTAGLATHPLPRVDFADVRVPAEGLLGRVGDGVATVRAAFGSGAGVGALAVGVARAAFEFALRFAAGRRSGGRPPLLEHPVVATALVDARTRLAAAGALVHRAAAATDAGEDAAFELGLQAKVFASETAVDVVPRLMRVVGVESWSEDTPLARHLRDALAFPLISGSNDGVRRRQLVTLLTAPELG